MTITAKERKTLVKLLDKLQVNLESAIEGGIKEFIVAEDPQRFQKLMTRKIGRHHAALVRQDRIDWRTAEDWKIRLEKGA